MSNFSLRSNHNFPNEQILNISNDFEIQSAFQLILKAFEKKNLLFEKEVNNLVENVKVKDNKIMEYDNQLEVLQKEYKAAKDEIIKLKNENRNLIEITQKINEENNQLIRFKNTIISSLDFDTNYLTLNKEHLMDLLESKGEILSPIEKNSGNDYNVNLNSPIYVQSGKMSPNELSRNHNYNKNIYSSKQSPNDYLPKYKTEIKIEKLFDKLSNKYVSSENNSLIVVTDDSSKTTSRPKFEKKIEELKKKFKIEKYSSAKLKPSNYTERIKSSSNICKDSPNRGNSYDNSSNHHSPRKLENKSNQYILSSKFFNECRIRLRKEIYDELIFILNECGENRIDKREAYARICNILENHPRLLRDYQNIFPNINSI